MQSIIDVIVNIHINVLLNSSGSAIIQHKAVENYKIRYFSRQQWIFSHQLSTLFCFYFQLQRRFSQNQRCQLVMKKKQEIFQIPKREI